jgi:uncharacterized membrane protein
MTRWGYAAVAVTVALFVAAVGAHVTLADKLPDKVPTHWNLHGEVNGWTDKDNTFVIFYLLPTVTAGVVALGLFVLPWLSPQNFAVESFRRVYDYVFFLIAVLFAFLYALIETAQVTGTFAGERWMIAGFFVFFALIGNVLGKVKRNFWLGVRTPWTLADPQVWDRTHRVAAWWYVVVGVVGVIAASVGVHPIACFVFLIGGALVPVFYSLVLYKRLQREGKLDVQRQLPVGQE